MSMGGGGGGGVVLLGESRGVNGFSCHLSREKINTENQAEEPHNVRAHRPPSGKRRAQRLLVGGGEKKSFFPT